VAFSYGNLLLRLNRYPQAAEVFEVLLDHSSSVPGGKISVAASFINVGTAYQGLGRYDDAEKAFTNAGSLFGEEAAAGSLSAMRNQATALLGVASLESRRGNQKKAVELAKQAVQLDRAGHEKDGIGTDQLAGALVEFADLVRSDRVTKKDSRLSRKLSSCGIHQRLDCPCPPPRSDIAALVQRLL